MIEQDQVLQRLLSACPAFEPAYLAHVADHGDDLLYLAAGEFAETLLTLREQGDEAQLASAGAAIEQLHLEGTPWVKELATIGLLESIQNLWGNRGVDPDLFVKFLGPESLRWWNGLNRFWEGKSSSVQPDP